MLHNVSNSMLCVVFVNSKYVSWHCSFDKTASTFKKILSVIAHTISGGGGWLSKYFFRCQTSVHLSVARWLTMLREEVISGTQPSDLCSRGLNMQALAGTVLTQRIWC